MKKRGTMLLLTAMLLLSCALNAKGADNVMDIACTPSGITAVPDGSFLVTDLYGKVVWKLEDGKSILFAGGGGVEGMYGEPVGGYRDGKLEQALFRSPWAITPFLDGYAVSDSENDVVRLVSQGGCKTLAGTGKAGYTEGKGTKAALHNPTGLAVDQSGNLYVADTGNHVVRKVDANGNVSTWVRGLSEPTGLCWSGQALYIADSGNNRIVKVEEGAVILVAGSGEAGRQDGEAGQASFSNPQGVAVADDGTVYVSDTGNGAIRKVAGGAVTTLLSSQGSEMALYPVSPVGILIQGDTLYVCDSFARCVFTLPR